MIIYPSAEVVQSPDEPLGPAAIVGRLGAAPLGAVGLSNLVFFFCQAFFGFLLIVTTPRVANAVAGGNDAEVSTRLPFNPPLREI